MTDISKIPVNELKILALDPANKCGWAHSDGMSGTWDLSVKRDESSGMGLLRFAGKLNEILGAVGVDVVFYEAARHAAPKMQGSLVRQALIQGVLIHWCEARQIEYRGYSPTEVKKHATGSGKANKEDMVKAAEEKFGPIEDDNHADALWILDMGMESLGAEKPLSPGPVDTTA